MRQSRAHEVSDDLRHSCEPAEYNLKCIQETRIKSIGGAVRVLFAESDSQDNAALVVAGFKVCEVSLPKPGACARSRAQLPVPATDWRPR